LGLDNLQAQLYSGGAALENDTVKYFESLDLGLVNFYGTTEATGPISTNIEGIITYIHTIGSNLYILY